MISITKITAAAPGSWIANEYSSVCPFSKENSYILLIAQDHFLIYDRTMGTLSDPHIGASERPRWSRRNTGQITYLRADTIFVYDVVLGIMDSWTFPEYFSLDDYGEADQQDDSRVLVGIRHDGTKEIFVFNVADGTKGLAMPITKNFNNLLLCPNGEILIDGKLLLDPSNKIGRLIADSDSHKAVGKDMDGRPILVRNNSNDPINPENKQQIVKVPLDGSEPTVLLGLDWNLAAHISLCDKFALVTTYDPTNPSKLSGPGFEALLHNSILRVAFDGSGAELLCHHRSDSSTYIGQPKASVSKDGSQFVFASNSGDPIGPVDTWLGIIAAPETIPEPRHLQVVRPVVSDRWLSQFWKMLLRLFGIRR